VANARAPSFSELRKSAGHRRRTSPAEVASKLGTHTISDDCPNERQTKSPPIRWVSMEDRFLEHCLKEAEECQREAERVVSPLDKSAWLHLASEWMKLAEKKAVAKVTRRL
jgi:hypothetical protein